MPRILRKPARSSRNDAVESVEDPYIFRRPSEHDSITVSRPRRAAAVTAAASTAAMQRMSSDSPEPTRKGLRLTHKPTPSRLREVTNESELHHTRNNPSRSTKNKRPIIDHDSEEDEEDDDMELDVADEDEEEDTPEDEEEEEELEDDEDSEVPLPRSVDPPRIRINGPGATSAARKPSPRRALGATKSVEDKEMADGSSDEALSDPEDLDDQEEEDEEEEEDDEEDEEEDEDIDMDAGDTIRVSSLNDDDLDSSDEDGSIDSSTPDPAKLTKRQRGAPDAGLLALSNEAQKKKFFTDEQITMRRAEMARRRKDLSEKRNQEEKADTLRRLLEKQPPKRRNKAQMMADAEREEFGGTPVAEGEVVRPSRAFVRTVMGYDSSQVGVPEEWIGLEVDRFFEGAKPFNNDLKPVGPKFRLVQEVE